MENMIDTINRTMHTAEMSDLVFCRLGEFIEKELGIRMPPSKKTMLAARLQKRLRFLHLKSFEEYYDYVFSPDGVENELIHMIDIVTTNKTDFYREPAHFDYLLSTALPELINLRGSGVRKKLLIWSAGCSTGEEPYTLAMVLQEFSSRYNALGFHYVILATDISTKVLKIAEDGIYSEDKIPPIPVELRRKYLLKSKDRNRKVVRIVPALRECVKFRRLNFKEGDFNFREPVDIIFCRNVTIYFDRAMQEKLLNRFYNHIIPGGYLFTGHSETLNGLDVPFVRVAPAIYRRPL